MAAEKKHGNKGFTLIELLVVIAIIALLLSIVMPSLKTAKEVAKRMVCSSNIRMLTTAWNTYAAENNGEMTEAKTTIVTEVSANPPTYAWSSTPYTWAGLWNGSVDNKNALEGAIKIGTFYPYNETLKIYKCTNHEAYARGNVDTGMIKRIRSYAIVDSMNGYNLNRPKGGVPFKKLSELSNAGSQIVFIDEGLESPEGWTIYPDQQVWWDNPPIQHNNGGVVSFADNHAEYWKWEDKRTLQYTESNIYNRTPKISAADAAKNNPDFERVQQGIWNVRRGR